MKYPKLHPTSIKLLRQGHPWITEDKYSLAFPEGKELLVLGDGDKSFGTFLHDPKHPKIKARFLTEKVSSLTKYLERQLKLAIAERSAKNYKRDNYYLCFSDADGLSGLYIQKLGQHILIQYHAYAWEKYIKRIIIFLKENNIGTYYWKQMRIPGEQKVAPTNPGFDTPLEPVIDEYGINLKLKFDLNHDIGVYTDMAAIRGQIDPYFKNKKKALNLFAYTGAFSLQALKHGAEVTSVDLSKTYMAWLEENIELNPSLPDKHTSVVTACDRFLNKNQDKFDLIISDPPSFSSNGKKRESSYDFYKKNWELLWDQLSVEGNLIVFLNTHSVTRDKFRKLIRDKTKGCGHILRELRLSDDCPILAKFPEGDYLKGFVISKTK